MLRSSLLVRGVVQPTSQRGATLSVTTTVVGFE